MTVHPIPPRKPGTAGGIAPFPENNISDDKNKTGNPDRQRVNVNEDYELRDWAAKWGVSEQRVRDAVGKVGTMADDVERELKG